MSTKTVAISKVIDPSTDYVTIRDEMDNAGCRYIVSGAFGSVYSSNDKDVVFKIFEIDSNSGYLAYLDVAIRHQSNPFFPVIYSVNYYYADSTKTNGVVVVEMERLEESHTIEKQYENDWTFQGIYTKTRDWFNEMMHTVKGEKNSIKKTNYILQALDPAYSAAYALKRKYLKVGVGLDMHSGNFMFRKVEGLTQLVITDPFV